MSGPYFQFMRIALRLLIAIRREQILQDKIRQRLEPRIDETHYVEIDTAREWLEANK